MARRQAAVALLPPVLVQVTGVLPVFLVGAVAVQLEEDLGMTAGQLGLVASTFFLAGGLASIPMGRIGDRVGAARALRYAAAASGVALALIATVAQSWQALVPILIVAGVAQAMVDSGSNVYLVRSFPDHRLGAAIGAKQASVPMATLLGGLAVPAIAVPFGWRWVFAFGALVAVLSILICPRREPVVRARKSGQPDVPTGALVLLAVAFGAGTGAATTVGAFAVGAGASTGLSASAAGFAAALASAANLLMRLTLGFRSDRRTGQNLPIVAGMLALGTVSLLLLALDSRLAFLLALPVANAAVGGWPGLLQLTVVRSNPSAPGAASGLVGMGAFIGCAVTPTAVGAIADRAGYSPAWILCAVMALCGAITITAARRLGVERRTPALAVDGPALEAGLA